MRTIVQLIDSVPYIRENCFQHQLAHALGKHCRLVQIELRDIIENKPVVAHDGVISCLKQRTLMKHAPEARALFGSEPIVVYDQDPWQAYMDDSPYKGAYEYIAAHLNVRAFAMTTQWWVDFVKSKGHPTMFAKMGVLPEYCVPRKRYVERSALVGFVGSVHPRRRALLDVIEASGVPTSVLQTNSLMYASFLDELAKLRVFVHNEDMTYTVDDGYQLNFNTGMWVKDIEAASQGCFSIRGKGDGSMTYLEGAETVFLYDNMSEVPGIIKHIEAMDENERQSMIDRTVGVIKGSDVWSKTALSLIENACSR